LEKALVVEDWKKERQSVEPECRFWPMGLPRTPLQLLCLFKLLENLNISMRFKDI
jgi:hypothetical protein